MRTTLELDDELVVKAKAIAKERGETLGQVISDLAQKGLPTEGRPIYRNGARQLQSDPGRPRPTLALINRLRDEE